MPTGPRREDQIIQLFVKVYEDRSRRDTELAFPDKVKDGQVDGFATRADGSTLAIEHTIVEPFVGDIADQTELVPMFPSIEGDASLVVPGTWIRLFVPVGTFHLQGPRIRERISDAVHDWLRTNRLSLPKGDSKHPCKVTGTLDEADIEITLTLSVVDLPGEGELHVRRQQVGNTFGDVVEKVLTKKLPKLVKVEASKRVLLLERQHSNLRPETIHEEIQKRRAAFPALADVEIWIATKTPFFEKNKEDVRFEHWEGGQLVKNFVILDGQLRKNQTMAASILRQLEAAFSEA